MHSPRFCVAAMSCIALTIPSLTAQMAGNYTIDAAGSGSRNYRTFQAAVVDLWKQGMSGSVTITVASGIYNENVALVPIGGMSATRTLTFRSKTKHQAVLSTTGVAFRLSLSTTSSPISGLVFDGLEFRGSYGVLAQSPVTDLLIRNCRFPINITNTGISGAATRWTIDHCYFNPTNSRRAFELRECDDVSIHHCEFKSSDCKLAPLIESTATKSSSKPTRIFNNVFHNRNHTAMLELGSQAFGVQVVHNSFLTRLRFTVIRISGHFTRPHLIANNIFASSYAGTASTVVVSVNSISAYDYVMNGNLFFARNPAAFLVQQWQSSSGYTSLAAWSSATGQDKNSVQGDPKTVSNNDLRLLQGSAAIDKSVATPSYITTDFDGRLRDSKPDIGAFELHVPFKVFGTGCAGTFSHVPVLGNTGTPAIGSTNFTVTLTKALGGSKGAFFALGASNKKWNGVPLPLAFGGGCNLLVSADLIIPIGVTGPVGPGTGVASIKIPIPNDPKLFGVSVHFQWGVIDPAAKGIGLAFSNGGTLSL